MVLGKDAPAYKLAVAGSMGESLCGVLSTLADMLAAGGIAGIVGNPGEIIMVRMQGDFAKPPEKRLNYKHCFDGLFKVSEDILSYLHIVCELFIVFNCKMVRDEGVSSLARGMTPNVFRAILMNASQLAS